VTVVPHHFGRRRATTTLQDRPPRKTAKPPKTPLETAARPTGTVPISTVRPRQRATVAGRVHTLRIQPRAGVASLEATIEDGTGSIVVVFLGRRSEPGIEPGVQLLVEGMVGERGNQ